ncbi:hypothetical protein BBJ28_00021067 [Nothophytophthora sp. Chile5]|nr:hypothetical protein BBJ28_00021067 [Nothophytophthora sp. Chile5]
MSLEHRTRRHGGVLARDSAAAVKVKMRKPSTKDQRARWNRKHRAKHRKPKRKKELSLLQQQRRALRKKRRRSALGLGVDYELPQEKLESAAIETLEMSATPSQTMKPCACVQCALLRRAHSPFAYRCPVFRCRTDFSDFVTLFEHQLDVHGLIYPHCRRLIAEMHHQERGVVPYPPATVYIGEQFFYPSVRPMAWTLLERVETERQTLVDKLTKVAASRAAQVVWKSFQVAYARIQQGGIRELRLQYRMALEYYNSSLTFPVANRSFQDGSASVAYGRNWLVGAVLSHHYCIYAWQLTE